ncbi:N-acetylglucosamine-6-phosphate deacetylase [Rheinheimera sp. MMS21-TC3]|uniref:N-acetylglucosamine-6-phosphate deacetylase n=1 Tax=Rheinheimera sp. MMS21-TC3 TaxID=3072790 RepID=UPI0028C4440C|nr:N-acetylglucosamine-6-phosphate deacetylase [Rheinheimera sp. MMS21-TC3]WNO60190.1 N-acetylglucosamine-6-phosphate deacetylase [Rheinheimera sp. MMS21-TC3]
MTEQISVSRLFDGTYWLENITVTIAEGIIQAITPARADITDGILVPGFIDVQVNGGGGVLFNTAPNLQTLATMQQAHARFGTTAFLPTVITDNLELMQQAAETVAQAVATEHSGVLGIHFEGPHLAVAKKGIHSEQYIRPISAAEMAIYSRTDLGIKLLTVAPETVSPEQIAELVALNVIVCLGHSNADVETVQAALAAGASGFTHLYNAMSGLASRAPGMVGAALADENSWCGLILDGQHLHPVAAKVALAAKPKGKVFLVTDAMSPVGSAETEFTFFADLISREGNKLSNTQGQLAGSVLDMISAVNYAINVLGLSKEEALNMASLYPAQLLQSQQHGRIEVGYRADLLLIDEKNTVLTNWVGGKVVYQHSSS